MTITKAVNHFVYKLNNVWKPTDSDADAINTIMRFVEDKHKHQYNDYHLFAKLYVMVYAQFLDKYEATVFDKIPVKELTSYLSKPLEIIIERFTQRLNDNEQYMFLKDLDIEIKHPALVSDEVKKNDINVLDSALNKTENKDRFYGDVWDYETVKQNLELQINDTINLL